MESGCHSLVITRSSRRSRLPLRRAEPRAVQRLGFLFVVLSCLVSSPARAAVIFTDDFTRPSSSTVGAPLEFADKSRTERDRSNDDVAVAGGRLRLRDQGARASQLNLSTLGDRRRLSDSKPYVRNRNLCNFPVSVLGSASRNSTALGYLYGATVAFT